MEEKVIVTKSKLTAIGDNIRNQTNTTKQYTLDEMASMKLGGTDTSDATATSEDILLGKTAYVNDVQVVGTIEEYDGEQEGGIDNTQEDGLITKTITEYTNNRVTKIGAYAFHNCSALTSANLPLVTSVEDYAFHYCSALTNIDLPLVTSAGTFIFYNCSALTSANLPLLTSVGAYLFYNCSALTNIDLPLLTSAGTYVFAGCRKLTSANLPLVTSVGNYAFQMCELLTNMNLPNLTNLNNYAFHSCYKLASAFIPLVTSIGKSAFYSCFSLKAVIIQQSNTVCTLSNTNAFSSCHHILGTVNSTYNPNGDKDGYIYVPDSLVDSYKSATNWSTFADQIKPLSELPQEYKDLYNIN